MTTAGTESSERPVVLALSVFPEKGRPGRALVTGEVTAAGLAGDRAKRHPLLVATPQDLDAAAAAGDELRANVVVSLPADELAAAGGHELRLGEAVVRIDRRPSACEGMYADVVAPGAVAVGDAADWV